MKKKAQRRELNKNKVKQDTPTIRSHFISVFNVSSDLSIDFVNF